MVKTKLLLKVLTGLLILFNVNCINAQNVNIPDANFKKALLDHGIGITGVGVSKIDTDGDGEISVSEAQAYTGTINVGSKSISDLTGIEVFTSLTSLYCHRNQLTSLDVSANKSLKGLDCTRNKLTSLDVSANKSLIGLTCSNNQLTSLDVSANTKLSNLYCSTNRLTSLDVSANTKLSNLFCSHNLLTSLDLSANTKLTYLQCHVNKKLTSLNIANGNNAGIKQMSADYNPSLACIQTDASIVGTTPDNWYKSSDVIYSVDCSGVPICVYIDIPDANFKKALLDHGVGITGEGISKIDTNGDGKICQDEAQAYTGVISVPNRSISDLTGIEAFTALKGLDANTNHLTVLDLSNNTNLVSLKLWENILKEIDLTQNIKLQKLSLSRNYFKTIDISKNTELQVVAIKGNQISSIDVSKNIKLTGLFLDYNRLTQLDVSNNKALTKLRCHDNQLTSLNIANGNNTNMIVMQAQKNPNLTCIQTDLGISGIISGWQKDFGVRYSVNCSSNCTNIVNIPDANFKNALLDHGVGITGEGISKIDTDGDGEICQNEAEAYTGVINVGSKSILDLTGIEAFTALTKLFCYSNKLTNLDTSANTALTELYCSYNQLTSLGVSANTKLTYLDCNSNQLTNLDVSKNTALKVLTCQTNKLTSLDVNANTELTYLNFGNNQLTSLNVSSNTKLTYLNCEDNQLTSLNVSANTALIELYSSKNQLTNLDISANKSLTKLICYSNKLTGLDISANTALTELYCSYNQLTSLNVSSNTKLTYLDCNNNQLTNLDVSKNTALKVLTCRTNKLTRLDVSANTELTYLNFGDNQLTNLDISANTALTELYSNDNQLTSLNIANGNNTNMTAMKAQNNSSLTCIQTDANIVGTSPNNWQKDTTASYNENCSTASVNEVSFNDRFKIYPNPVGSTLTIKTDNTTIKHIEIYNLLGEKILKTTSQNMNVSKLTKGMYIVKIQSVEGKVATKKFIKK